MPISSFLLIHRPNKKVSLFTMRPFNLTYRLRRTTKIHVPTDDTIAKIDKTIAINCILLASSFFSTLDTSPCSPVSDVPFAIVVSECGFQLFHRLSIQQFLHLYIVDMHPKLFFVLYPDF